MHFSWPQTSHPAPKSSPADSSLASSAACPLTSHVFLQTGNSKASFSSPVPRFYPVFSVHQHISYIPHPLEYLSHSGARSLCCLLNTMHSFPSTLSVNITPNPNHCSFVWAWGASRSHCARMETKMFCTLHLHHKYPASADNHHHHHALFPSEAENNHVLGVRKRWYYINLNADSKMINLLYITGI